VTPRLISHYLSWTVYAVEYWRNPAGNLERGWLVPVFGYALLHRCLNVPVRRTSPKSADESNTNTLKASMRFVKSYPKASKKRFRASLEDIKLIYQLTTRFRASLEDMSLSNQLTTRFSRVLWKSHAPRGAWDYEKPKATAWERLSNPSRQAGLVGGR